MTPLENILFAVFVVGLLAGFVALVNEARAVFGEWK